MVIERHIRSYIIPEYFESNSSMTKDGERAEEKMYNLFANIKTEPMIVFHSQKFSEKVELLAKGKKQDSKMLTGEIDFLIVHKKFGVILLEVKSSNTIRAYKKAKYQLGKGQQYLQQHLQNCGEKIVHEINPSTSVVLPNVSRADASGFPGCFLEDVKDEESFLSWLKSNTVPPRQLRYV